jgi:polysaccharide export outer membrane protein
MWNDIMNLYSKQNARIWAVAATLPVLVACSAVGPGMRFESTRDATNTAEEREAVAIPTEVKPITQALLKREKDLRDKQSAQDISKLIGSAGPYKIESGDILSIVVWDHPELAGAAMAPPNPNNVTVADQAATTTPAAGFVVDHQGMVQFPYAGTLKLAGLTEDEARTMLSTRLAKYINKPNVTLRVQSFRSKRVYVDGEVKAPGLQAINDIPMTLIEAINRAGGLLPTADQSQLALIRQGTTYQLNLPQLVQKGVNPASIMMVNGDVLRVLSRDESKVFISGEVTQPRSLTMHNGRLTLNEALGESGGVNPLSGDASQIYVVRKSTTEPVVYRLDANVSGALAMAEGFELNPKDVVYVAATPLANWHRTISQMLPGALSSAVGAANLNRYP